MANSLHAVGRATSAFEPMGPTNGGNLVCVTAHHSLTAAASTNDVFQMIKIPNGARIIDGYLNADATATAYIVSVGDGGDTARFVAAFSITTSGTAINFIKKKSLPYKYSLTSNANPQYDTIDVKLTGVVATVAGLEFDVTVWYLVDDLATS